MGWIVIDKLITRHKVAPVGSKNKPNRKAGRKATPLSGVNTRVQFLPVPQSSQPAASSAPVDSVQETLKQQQLAEAVAKYKELYGYSTDVLLNEHSRFTRADDKASRYSTIFVFLIGIAAYFEKWALDHVIKRPEAYFDYAAEWPVMVVGAIALALSGIGWLVANQAIMGRRIANRQLSKQTLKHFDNHDLLTVYYSLAKKNTEAYQENVLLTEKKYCLLRWAHMLMLLSLGAIADLVLLYCLYSLL